jgi:adhesin transport system outer membrane protein
MEEQEIRYVISWGWGLNRSKIWPLILLAFSGASAVCANQVTLGGLVSLAIQAHPAVIAQAAQAQAAQAGVESARWQFYPTPSIAIETVGGSGNDPSYRGDSQVSTLRLQQPLWSGGRLTAGLTKAQAGVVVVQATSDEVRLQLASRVVQAYGDWLSAFLRLRSFEKSLDAHLYLFEQVRHRVERGVAADSDRVLVDSRLASLRADRAQSQGQKIAALARLGQLVGRQVDDAELIELMGKPFLINVNAIFDVRIHPSVRKLQAQAAMQKAATDERRAELSPEVFMRVENQYGNYAIREAAPESRIFIGLVSRFGAGLSSQTNVASALAQYSATLAEVDVKIRDLDEQISTDHAVISVFEARMKELNVSSKAAEQGYESYARQFSSGRKTWQDVLNAVREITQIEVQLAEINASQIVLTWRVAMTTQGLDWVLLNEKDSAEKLVQMSAPATEILAKPPVVDSMHFDQDHAVDIAPLAVQQGKDGLSPPVDDRQEIIDLVMRWALVWSSRDVVAYLALYADDFKTPNGESRSTWARQRTNRLQAPVEIQVSISISTVDLTGDLAAVSFIQEYRTSSKRLSTRKTLYLQRFSGRWLIVQETVVRGAL